MTMTKNARHDEVRARALDDMRRFEVVMEGHFDYGNGFHGKLYLNPHQLVQHPSTIWRVAQDLIDVTPADTPGPTRLALADLPERQRLAVSGAIRREINARRFTPDEAAELATGADVLPHVAARALLRAVAALEHDQSAAAIGAVSDLVDLLDLENQHIPFDVQTEFYRIHPQVPRDLAQRLGFAEGD